MTKNNKFVEYSFIINCMKLGFSIDNIKKYSYVDMLKFMISTIDKKNTKQGYRLATQEDIDRLVMGG